jgi:hypothetical protein
MVESTPALDSLRMESILLAIDESPDPHGHYSVAQDIIILVANEENHNRHNTQWGTQSNACVSAPTETDG